MPKVKDFLSAYRNYNTMNNHRQALHNFFSSAYSECNLDQLDELAERYFSENRDVEKDLENFLVYIRDYAPLTKRNKVSSVRNFLVENDVELPQKFWRRLVRRIEGSRALTLDKVPSNIELRRLLTHMPVQGRALYLLLSSSGMRIGEALQLTLEDLLVDEEPLRIQIRGEYTKTGNSRHAFASRETKEALEEWFKIRSEYLEAAVGKSHQYEKSMEDDRLFPFQSTTAYLMWRGALKKAKMAQRDKSTNIEKLHPHVLRKFFRTRLGAVIPVYVVEALMGHEGYLTEVYRRYTVEDLAKFYLQGEGALLVFTEAEEVSKLRIEVEERNTTLQTLVNGLTAENLELKSRVSRVELENTDLKKRFQLAEQKLAELDQLIREVLESKN